MIARWGPALRRFAIAVRFDVVNQWRHRYYHVYAVITALYVAGLHFLPRPVADVALPLVIFGDPAILGFLFVAAIVLFERDDRVLEGVSVSPLRPGEYVTAKAVSLAVLSVAASLAIALSVRGLSFNLPLLVLATGLTGSAFALIGLGLVAPHANLSRFLFVAVLAELVLNLPLVGLFLVGESPVLYALPTLPGLAAISAAFGLQPLSLEPARGPLAILTQLALLVVWNGVLFRWASGRFRRWVLAGRRGRQA